MTVGLGILTRNSIVLASDSALSFLHEPASMSLGQRKLHALIKTGDIGLMHYGALDLGGEPLEDTLARFQKEHPAKHDTFAHACDAFFNFMRTELPTHSQIERSLNAIAASILEDFRDRALFYRNRLRPQGDFGALVSQRLENAIAFYQNCPASVPVKVVDPLLKRFGDSLEAIANEQAIDLELKDHKGLLALLRAALLADRASGACLGLVVAGFGEKENAPSIRCFEIDGWIGKHFKIVERREYRNDLTSDAYICPIAQGDVIQRFVQGYDSRLIDMIIRHAMNSYAEALNSAYRSRSRHGIAGERDRKHVQQLVEKLSVELDAKIEGEGRAFVTEPLLEKVSLMSDMDLLDLAWHLINITLVDRRYAFKGSSVGGSVQRVLIKKAGGVQFVGDDRIDPMKKSA